MFHEGVNIGDLPSQTGITDLIGECHGHGKHFGKYYIGLLPRTKTSRRICVEFLFSIPRSKGCCALFQSFTIRVRSKKNHGFKKENTQMEVVINSFS